MSGGGQEENHHLQVHGVPMGGKVGAREFDEAIEMTTICGAQKQMGLQAGVRVI